MENTLPKNWVGTSPKDISQILRGVSYGKTDAFQEKFVNSCLILRGGNIQDGNIVDGKDDVFVDLKLIKDEQLVNEGDVIIVGSTGSKQLIGKAATVLQNSNEVSFGAFLMAIRADKNMNKWFFSYYFQTDYYREAIRNLAGGVNINNIRKEYIENLYFPLPPLAEQNRIVEKLDTLFAQLETIKTSMAKVPELLKNFRQQVLTQAVTGKLTEEWRKGKGLEEWKIKRIEEIADSLSGFAFKSTDFSDEGIQLIRMGNLYNNKLDLERNPVFLPFKYDKKVIEKYSLRKNDVLLSLTGTKYKRDYGFAIKIETDKKLLLNQRILALRPKINIDYFLYSLRDNIFRDKFFSFETGGVNQGNVGTKGVLSIMLSIPSVIEQEEIVRRVESLFAKADTIEKQYESLKAKIDSLPQAILHKAFKGELTQQLDSDGDARELLREVEELKKDNIKSKKK
jgi:type I restriction enzyme, S subunit